MEELFSSQVAKGGVEVIERAALWLAQCLQLARLSMARMGKWCSQLAQLRTVHMGR